MRFDVLNSLKNGNLREINIDFTAMCFYILLMLLSSIEMYSKSSIEPLCMHNKKK